MDKVFNFNKSEEIDTSQLFTNRYEKNYVFKKDIRLLLEKEIVNTLGAPKCKTELVATTYFEPILNTDPNTSSVLRFRQKLNLKDGMSKIFRPPTYWYLAGPGNLELKTKNKKANLTIKRGSFITDEKNKDIYALMDIAKSESDKKQRLAEFILHINSNQEKNLNIHSTDQRLSQISYKELVKFSSLLTPRITRVCIRKTFLSQLKPNIKITFECFPTFYPYPLEHSACALAPSKTKYVARLAEKSNRIKMEIKTKSRKDLRVVSNKFLSLFQHFLVSKNKETLTPYSKMVVSASKIFGTIITEQPLKEIETKANLPPKTNIKALSEKMRNMIIAQKNGLYKVFTADPDLTVRGDWELDRTIIGWRDGVKKWHEIVTIIKLNEQGLDEYGYKTILKWKSDNETRSNGSLNRYQKHDYFKHDIDVNQLLKRLVVTKNEKLEIVGKLRKIKYRFIVQDKEGRNFVVSLDKCTSLLKPRSLCQLEVEYYYTYVKKGSILPHSSIEKSCTRCLDYFLKIINNFNVKAEKTDFRKIDFVASLK